MKLLSIAVPCYNSAAYMKKCIESLLTGGDRVEIIIVDDGSTKDNTLEIAKDYEAKSPGTVRAVHQENGGHGEAVNTGLANATGLYFKVVDSDDHLDPNGLKKVLDKLEEFSFKSNALDMLICNYVYDKEGARHKKVMAYRTALPMNRVFDWNSIRYFHAGQYILMHSVIYRTQLLKDCGLRLPKHTFYVDNLFMFKPLPDVKTIYYMPLDLYRYFIGRADQSVTLENGAKRYDQQIRVTKMMVDCFDLRAMGKTRPKLRRYLLHELGMMVLICAVFTYADDTPERRKNFYDVWKYIKEKDRWLYRRLRWSSTAMVATGKSKFGRWIDVCGYRFFKRIVKFG